MDLLVSTSFLTRYVKSKLGCLRDHDGRGNLAVYAGLQAALRALTSRRSGSSVNAQ